MSTLDLISVCVENDEHATEQTCEIVCIQGVTGGMDQTSGECSLGQNILI